MPCCFFRPVAAFATAAALAGCASLPPDRGYAETADLVESRAGAAPAWSSAPADRPGDAVEGAPDALSVEQAIHLAFFNNPQILEEYARIGLGRAELEEARRIANPSLSLGRLRAAAGDGAQISRSLSLSFTDLLLLPARKRFAEGELQRLQASVAARLLDIAAQVEVAWYEAVGAQQVAAMREAVAKAAEQSVALAQRFFDAGNINRLQLERERAAAAMARIAAVRADAVTLRARVELAGLLGLTTDSLGSLLGRLPAPASSTWSEDDLVAQAVQQRLDLAAAEQEVALREAALGVARRWRWLGAVELGYERESELEGGVIRGPSLSLQLPLFSQGQAAIARAQAELGDSRARRDALALAVRNEARLGVARLRLAHDIAERYRSALLPSREAIVARTQEQVNFMLIGVFELILARQEEFDAYQEYLEAVRDFWVARTELRRLVGGRLPDDGTALTPSIGVEAILPPPVVPPTDHSMHGGTP